MALVRYPLSTVPGTGSLRTVITGCTYRGPGSVRRRLPKKENQQVVETLRIIFFTFTLHEARNKDGSLFYEPYNFL